MFSPGWVCLLEFQLRRYPWVTKLGVMCACFLPPSPASSSPPAGRAGGGEPAASDHGRPAAAVPRESTAQQTNRRTGTQAHRHSRQSAQVGATAVPSRHRCSCTEVPIRVPASGWAAFLCHNRAPIPSSHPFPRHSPPSSPLLPPPSDRWLPQGSHHVHRPVGGAHLRGQRGALLRPL